MNLLFGCLRASVPSKYVLYLYPLQDIFFMSIFLRQNYVWKVFIYMLLHHNSQVFDPALYKYGGLCVALQSRRDWTWMVGVQMGCLLLHSTYIAHLPSSNTDYKLRIKRGTERVCRWNESQNTRDGLSEACSRVLLASQKVA